MTQNSTVRFLKFTPKKEIYEKFEERYTRSLKSLSLNSIGEKLYSCFFNRKSWRFVVFYIGLSNFNYLDLTSSPIMPDIQFYRLSWNFFFVKVIIITHLRTWHSWYHVFISVELCFQLKYIRQCVSKCVQ